MPKYKGRGGWIPPHLRDWEPTKGERLDLDKFRALDRYSVMRHFGTNFRIDDCDRFGATLTAFGQDPVWKWRISRESLEERLVAGEFCYWGGWPDDFCAWCGREWRKSRYCPDCE